MCKVEGVVAQIKRSEFETGSPPPRRLILGSLRFVLGQDTLATFIVPFSIQKYTVCITLGTGKLLRKPDKNAGVICDELASYPGEVVIPLSTLKPELNTSLLNFTFTKRGGSNRTK